MRQGWLWLILIFCSLQMVTSVGQAQEMSLEQRDNWLAQPDLSEKVDELLALARNNDIGKLDFSIQGLAFPQQEVIRYLLLQRLEQSHLTLSDQLAAFVAKQRLLAPLYHIVAKGDGFEFYSPAFDYPAVANRLMKSGREKQSVSEFIQNVRERKLDLKLWLTGEPDQAERHQVLLLQELPQLTAEEVQYLAGQIRQKGVVSWLPSNRIMVALAKVSQDPALYKLLWLKRADLDSEREVTRLAQLHDPFSVEQLILASHNPRLKRLVQSSMTRIFPMPDRVRQFLIEQMSHKDDVNFVARKLIEQGYRSWLEELAAKNDQVQSTLLKQELAK